MPYRDWPDKTADEILRELTATINEVRAEIGRGLAPTMAVISLDFYRAWTGRRLAPKRKRPKRLAKKLLKRNGWLGYPDTAKTRARSF